MSPAREMGKPIERIPIDEARPILGDLALKAQMTGVPTILTRYGKDVARIEGIAREEGKRGRAA